MLESFGEEFLDEKQQPVKHIALESENISLVTCWLWTSVSCCCK